MKKIKGLGAIILAGLLTLPGNLGLAGQVLAQSQPPALTEKQYQELQQKRQEEWEYYDQKEKKQHPGVRLPAAGKRQDDALKRQREAEKRLRELEEEDK